jgi:hypothetical protein
VGQRSQVDGGDNVCGFIALSADLWGQSNYTSRDARLSSLNNFGTGAVLKLESHYFYPLALDRTIHRGGGLENSWRRVIEILWL